MARKEREEEEEEGQEEGKAFKKTFTKKSKKIGRAITFEDQPFKIEAVVERMQKEEAPCVPLNPVNRSLQVKTFQNWGNKLRERCIEKKVKKLTSVSFMYVCIAENVELLVFFYFFFAPSP